MVRRNRRINNISFRLITALALLRVTLALPAPTYITIDQNSATESQSYSLGPRPSTPESESSSFSIRRTSTVNLPPGSNPSLDKVFCFNIPQPAPGPRSDFNAGKICKGCKCEGGAFECNGFAGTTDGFSGNTRKTTDACQQQGRCRCITNRQHQEINKAALMAFIELKDSPAFADFGKFKTHDQIEFEKKDVAFCFNVADPQPWLSVKNFGGTQYIIKTEGQYWRGKESAPRKIDPGLWGSTCGTCHCGKEKLECEDPSTSGYCKQLGRCQCITATEWREINSAALLKPPSRTG